MAAMQVRDQRDMAMVIHGLQEQLDELKRSLGERGEPVELIMRRLNDVESALFHDLDRRAQPLKRLGYAAYVQAGELRWRVRQLASPRITGQRLHAPRGLTVPTAYLRTPPPPPPAPVISITTPTYGQGQFLERTIFSILGQAYPALEYVIEDGGSTDQTVDILRRYEPWLKRWASAPDAGQGDAINRGFAGTSGEIMAYLNSDDLLLPGSLAFVARYFVEHPQVDVVYGNRILIDEQDRVVGIWVLPAHDERVLTLADYVPQETLFWRRSAWEAAGGEIDTSFRFAIDWDLLLRLQSAGARIVHVPRFLGAFRMHATQKTATENDLCVSECYRLRRRLHDRTMSGDVAIAQMQPYLRAHVAAHIYETVKARLPLIPRTSVRTVPVEPLPSPEMIAGEVADAAA
jgi:GT2 family glycosyltransferase